MKILQAGPEHLDQIEQLYDDVNDYLMTHTNYPGWIKGLYPARDTAEAAVREKTMYLMMDGERIAGSVILNHVEEEACTKAVWLTKPEPENIMVVHTLLVHPDYLRMGIAEKLMEFTMELAVETGMETVRIDVTAKNKPAIGLYEKCGFQYVDTIDLGLPYEHLKWFRLYEYPLKKA